MTANKSPRKATKNPLSLSVIIPCYNEEKFILQKLNQLSSYLNQIQNLNFEIVVGNDGSTDQTSLLIKKWIRENESSISNKIKFVDLEKNQGKWNLLKQLLKKSKHDILLISDTSSIVPIKTIQIALDLLQDNSIAVVSPTYDFSKNKITWQSLYWRYVRMIKDLESKIHTTCGSHGSGYFIRKERLPNFEKIEPLKYFIINDDFIIPTLACQNGHRNIYLKDSPIIESEDYNPKHELKRRNRMALGNIAMAVNLLQILKFKNEFWLKYFFISQKALRTIIFPTILLGNILSILFFHDHRHLSISVIILIFILVFPPAKASLVSIKTYRQNKKVDW